MMYLSSLKCQSFVYWANHFASAAVITEKLVNVNLPIFVRKVQRAGYGTNVKAVSAAFRTLRLVNGDFAFNELPNFDCTWSALVLA